MQNYLKPRETRTRSTNNTQSRISSSWRGSASVLFRADSRPAVVTSLITIKEEIGASTGNGGGLFDSRLGEIGTELPTCKECRKIFPSLKSLHGHMRCHRKTREIPTPLSSHVTSPPPLPVPPSNEPDDEVVTAATILIQMSRDYSQGFDINTVNDDHNSKVEGVELIDNSSTKPLPRTYFCRICTKSFASYQALGGHTAGHNRRRKMKEERKDLDDSDDDDPTYVGESAPTYRCPICNKTFSSKVALEGHERQQRGNPMHGKEVKVPKVELD